LQLSIRVLLGVLGLTLIAGCVNPTQGKQPDATPVEKFAVTYDSNGATGMAPVDELSPYLAGTKVPVLGLGNLEKSGFRLAGWNTRADGSGTTCAVGKILTLGASDVTLYAIWLDNHLTFDTSSESSPLEITGVDDPFALKGPLVVPGGVTRIAGGALGSSRVTSITIASSVTEVGYNAFGGCTELTDVTFLGADTVLAAMVFNQCTSLVHVGLPAGLISVPSGLFFHCLALKTVTLPNTVQSIGFDAFGDCLALTAITLPNSLKEIRQWAFEYTGLTQIDIPSSVTNIEFNPFKACVSLTTVTLLSATPPEVLVANADSTEDNDWGENLDQFRVPQASLAFYHAHPRWSVVLALAHQVVAQ